MLVAMFQKSLKLSTLFYLSKHNNFNRKSSCLLWGHIDLWCALVHVSAHAWTYTEHIFPLIQRAFLDSQHLFLLTSFETFKQNSQSCAVAVPAGHWHLIFAPRPLENLVFSWKSYDGHPEFHRFRALPGSLQFLLEHSFDSTMQCNYGVIILLFIFTLKECGKANIPSGLT